MKPLVSILIPSYNAERWIADTVRSALAQTWEGKEIIIVDDGSSDNTVRIAKKFESKSLKIILQKNRGAPAARNKALSLAQGDYIQWLDHDDLLAHDKIALQLRAVENGDDKTLLSGSFGMFYYRPQRAKFIQGPLWRNMTPIEYFLTKFNGNTWMQTSVWLINRNLTEQAGPWREARSPDDDGEYMCRVVSASKGIKFVEEARSYWRVGNYGSMSKSRSRDSLEALLANTLRSIDHLLALEDSERTRRASVKFIQDRLLWFLPEAPDLVEKARLAALELGGRAELPKLPWKYRAVRKFCGLQAAMKLKQILPQMRVCAARNFDLLMHKLQG